jgi:hypothetical protein
MILQLTLMPAISKILTAPMVSHRKTHDTPRLYFIPKARYALYSLQMFQID